MSEAQKFVEMMAYALASAGATGFTLNGERWVLNFRRNEDSQRLTELERYAKREEERRRAWPLP